VVLTSTAAPPARALVDDRQRRLDPERVDAVEGSSSSSSGGSEKAASTTTSGGSSRARSRR
jgi:hypothetical protein